MRKAGNGGECKAGDAGHRQRFRMQRELPEDVAAEIACCLPLDDTRVTSKPAAIDTISEGICETRPSPTVRIVYVCSASPNDMPALRDAHREAADDIDQRDDEPRDRIALDELHRAVERAVEVGFALELARAACPLRMARSGRCAVGVDAHLPPGNAVEREARATLRRRGPRLSRRR